MSAAPVAPVVDGWKVLADYAEPIAKGEAWVECLDGVFTVAVDATANETVTRVPVAVIRALLASYDARQAMLGDAANHDEKTEPNNAIPGAP